LKEGEIPNLAKKAYSEKKIIEEIDKCVLLCSNCHRELHFLKKEKELIEKLKYRYSLV
jgi:predicted HNH restriction endonuclease